MTLCRRALLSLLARVRPVSILLESGGFEYAGSRSSRRCYCIAKAVAAPRPKWKTSLRDVIMVSP